MWLNKLSKNNDDTNANLEKHDGESNESLIINEFKNAYQRVLQYRQDQIDMFNKKELKEAADRQVITGFDPRIEFDQLFESEKNF